MHDPTWQENEMLYIISAVPSCLSLLGDLFIILLYIYIPSLRLYVFRLVFYISICNAIKSIILLIPSYSLSIKNEVCMYAAYFYAIVCLSENIWVLAIAWSLSQFLVQTHHHIEYFHKYWVFFGFFIPALISGLPYLTNSYGFSVGWCTLKDNKIGSYWRIAILYIPNWLIVLAIIGIYVRIRRRIKETVGIDEEAESKKSFVKRITAYPIIMIVTLLPITCVRVFEIFEFDCDFVVIAIAYFFYSIYGFLNSVAYGYNDTVISGIKGKLIAHKINFSEASF